MKRIIVYTLALSGLLATPALASPQPPSIKPRIQYVSNVLSERDFSRLDSALEAADSGAWSTVRNLRGKLDDKDARNLLLWRITTDNASNATFSELSTAVDLLEGWPRHGTIRRMIEENIAESRWSDRERRDFFERNPPLTGDGKLEQARLARQAGDADTADAIILDVWRNHALSRDATRTLIAQHGRMLDRAAYAQRVDMLLWAGLRSDARRLLSELTNAERKVAEARLRLMERGRGVDAAVRAVPSSHQSDPGLLHDRAKWRRQRARNYDGAIELLLELDSADTVLSGRDNIWRERRIMLRTLIKEKRWKDAYAITENHNLSSGVEFAEAEFYAGWVALRHLNDPAAAYQHFDNLASNVGSPISLSRGHYWRGRALAAMGDEALAGDAYADAAMQIFTFYGQLAAQELEKMGRDDAIISFSGINAPSNEEMETFLARPIVRAGRLLAETGRIRDFERFSNHLDDQLTTPIEHQMLFDLTISYLLPRAGVRNGKTALANGVVTPDAAYPVIDLPESRGNGSAEPALVIALSRQESELQPDARSHANARGLMQMLPSTARLTARSVSLPYRTSWLTDDPVYNMRLGRTHLDELVNKFDGSYIMALAAYNAGASRPTRWIDDYGDPRNGEIDPIDWIESIPFSETRNYVMRIMENLQVYRHRLSGEPEAIRLNQDIRRGSLRR